MYLSFSYSAKSTCFGHLFSWAFHIANSSWIPDNLSTLVVLHLVIKADLHSSPPTNGWRIRRRCSGTCRTSKHQSHRQSQWSFLQDQANNPAEKAYGCLLRTSRQTGFNCAFSVRRNTSSSWRLSRHGMYTDPYFFAFGKMMWTSSCKVFNLLYLLTLWLVYSSTCRMAIL